MRLNNHPFPVCAFLRKSVVLSFAVPKEQLADKIPPSLSLDLFENQWAFLVAAMVKTQDLRPKGFPTCFGKDFILTGYRIFVRYQSNEGRNLRGLYILGSETNRPDMKRLGKLFTRYEYDTVTTEWTSEGCRELVSTDKGLQVKASLADENSALPIHSPFRNWKEARRFAGPMPFTFSHDAARNEVIIVEGKRSEWRPKPMIVEESRIPFFETEFPRERHLANAFFVENVPYEWKRGKVEAWRE